MDVPTLAFHGTRERLDTPPQHSPAISPAPEDEVELEEPVYEVELEEPVYDDVTVDEDLADYEIPADPEHEEEILTEEEEEVESVGEQREEQREERVSSPEPAEEITEPEVREYNYQ